MKFEKKRAEEDNVTNVRMANRIGTITSSRWILDQSLDSRSVISVVFFIRCTTRAKRKSCHSCIRFRRFSLVSTHAASSSRRIQSIRNKRLNRTMAKSIVESSNTKQAADNFTIDAKATYFSFFHFRFFGARLSRDWIYHHFSCHHDNAFVVSFVDPSLIVLRIVSAVYRIALRSRLQCVCERKREK